MLPDLASLSKREQPGFQEYLKLIRFLNNKIKRADADRGCSQLNDLQLSLFL
jgi:hypothetical protein